GCVGRSRFAGGDVHVSVGGGGINHAVEITAAHASVGGHCIEANSARHLNVKIELGMVAVPAARFGMNPASPAATRCLVLGINRTDGDAVRVLDDFNEKLLVVAVIAADTFDTGSFAGSAAGLDLAVAVDDFERLSGLQVSLPVEVALGENGPLFRLGASRDCGRK